MEIIVNQKIYHVTDACTVQHLLTAVLNTPVKGIAVAINQSIIPKANWETQVLNSKDQIIIIKATQGG